MQVFCLVQSPSSSLVSLILQKKNPSTFTASLTTLKINSIEAEIISSFEEMSLHLAGQRALSYNHYKVSRCLPAHLRGYHSKLFHAYDITSPFKITSSISTKHIIPGKSIRNHHPLFVLPVWITAHFQRHVPRKMDLLFCMIWTIILVFSRTWAETLFNPMTLGTGTTFAGSPRSILGSKF